MARGKVALFRNIVEDRTEIGPDTKEAFANCLLCRACTESCFSAVKTDKVVISFRHAYADRFGRGLLQRGVFRFLLPRPRLMRGLVQAVWVTAQDRPARPGPPGRPDRPSQSQAGAGHGAARRHPGTAPPFPPQDARGKAAGGRRPAAGRRRLGRAPRRLLDVLRLQLRAARGRARPRSGCWSAWATGWRCSTTAAAGWPPTATATWRRPRTWPARTCAGSGDLERFDAIVSECGSCSGHLKEYAELLADDPEWAERAALLTEKMRSFSEFVQEHGGLAATAARRRARPPSRPGAAPRRSRIVITYHDPCHLGKRYQNVTAQPRQILRSLEGYEFREAAESDSCCGAAGTYGVLHPETSAAIIDRKTGFIKDTGATVVATECPSCMMQLAYGLKRAGIEAEVRQHQPAVRRGAARQRRY